MGKIKYAEMDINECIESLIKLKEEGAEKVLVNGTFFTDKDNNVVLKNEAQM